MFSLTEIDDVAWILFLLMGAWLAINVLVDLSTDRPLSRDSRKHNDEQTDRRD